MLLQAFAIVEFSDVDSALRALRNSDGLMFQGSPLKVKPREVKTKARPAPQSANSSKDEATSAMEEGSGSTWRDTLSSSRLGVSSDDISKLEQAEMVSNTTAVMATPSSSYRVMIRYSN